MQALILSGGYGTRLRPLTFSCPKPIIPFCNLPIMEHQISALSKTGVTKIIIAVSDDPYALDKLKTFLRRCERKYSLQMILSVEKEPLGTAGPIALAKNHITAEDFFVLNSDIICSYPLEQLLRFHLERKAEGTLLTVKTDDPSKYGVIISSGNGLVERFIEKPREFVGSDINGGIYCLNRGVLDRLEVKSMSIEREIFPLIAADGKLFSFKIGESKFWMDIGQPLDYLRGTEIYIENTKSDAIISGSAELNRSAIIGRNVVIGDDCHIGGNVKLRRCVVFNGARIMDGSTVTDSIIGWDCIVNQNCLLENCVLERKVKVETSSILRDAIVCSHKTVNSQTPTRKVIL